MTTWVVEERTTLMGRAYPIYKFGPFKQLPSSAAQFPLRRSTACPCAVSAPWFSEFWGCRWALLRRLCALVFRVLGLPGRWGAFSVPWLSRLWVAAGRCGAFLVPWLSGVLGWGCRCCAVSAPWFSGFLGLPLGAAAPSPRLGFQGFGVAAGRCCAVSAPWFSGFWGCRWALLRRLRALVFRVLGLPLGAAAPSPRLGFQGFDAAAGRCAPWFSGFWVCCWRCGAFFGALALGHWVAVGRWGRRGRLLCALALGVFGAAGRLGACLLCALAFRRPSHLSLPIWGLRFLRSALLGL